MYRFLESIRIENGSIQNLEYHAGRMRFTLKTSGISIPRRFPESFFSALAIPVSGLFKLRIIYGVDIENFEIIPYSQKEINSLKVINVPRPEYSLKYADRSAIDALFEMRRPCDDILIVSDDVITDTSYCNVAFEKNSRWYTPAEPLLRGTMREYLLCTGTLQEAKVLLSQLDRYNSVALFNAMIPWERAVRFPVSGIQRQ